MRSDIWMNTSGSATKGLAELNNHKGDEQKNVRDGASGDAQGLSEEDESRFNEDAKFTKGDPKELEGRLVVQRIPQGPQQPLGPQVPVVRWERFLPFRSLKVLLVENDDSTRQVVSALLRNCSYEVTAVANGLEAWKTLEDLSNPVDLVLMEVVMPGLSGVDLLHKIMSHKTCKNIPVIMMSSNDSMDIVFKCLSKGAADFLVKPIRKNELKNLWQHVWRKCHSSSGSGSGSESGIRTQKSLKSRSIEESDNNTGSNEEDDASTSLNFRDGSDDGSGTQSSWTKRAVEVDSPQPMSPWGQPADPPDSTCALVIHSRQEAFSDNCLDMTGTRECNREDDKLNNVVEKGLETVVPGCSDLQLEDQNRKLTASLTEAKKEKLSAVESLRDCSDSGNSPLVLQRATTQGELRKEVAKIGCSDHLVGCVSTKVPIDIPEMNMTSNNSIHETTEIPSLDLSLKRPTGFGYIETKSQERIVLRHSGPSAFSRYNNSSTVNQAPGGNVGNMSLKAAIKYCGANTAANPGSNESTNNNDLGSTTNNTFAKATASSEKPMLKSAMDVHPYSAFCPVRDSHISSLQSVILNKDDASKVNTVLEQVRSKQPQIQVQHHHHHYHHHHHHVHDSEQEQEQQQKELLSNEDFAARTVVIKTQHSGPPGVLSAPVEGNAANYSLNETLSGSNNIVLKTEGINLVIDNGAPDAGGAGGGDESASGSRSGVDWLAKREAAVNKFRQKRKERSFEKKVRYNCRKRLAEERPRFRGKFARRAPCDDSKSKDEDS